MKGEPKIGSEHTRKFTVGKEHLIVFADDQMPAVLSSPQLILQLEMTAREAMEPLLEPHERTVGMSIDVNHLAPSVEGFTVTCKSRVLGFTDGEITFQIEATDGVDLLMRGMHKRKVVDVARVRKRVERKQAQRP